MDFSNNMYRKNSQTSSDFIGETSFLRSPNYRSPNYRSPNGSPQFRLSIKSDSATNSRTPAPCLTGPAFGEDMVRMRKVTDVASPYQMQQEYPRTAFMKQTVLETRDAISKVLRREDDRLVVICGPCSIHDPDAALEYARRLKFVADTHSKDLIMVMRVYFEKPRTTVGWKGLINDPFLDESFQVNTGLRTARKLLCDINALGVPVGCEFLDTMTPQYISDLVSWVAVGARTTECQLHRQLASGLSMPVGFKNGTSGDIDIAVDAMISSQHPHAFLTMTDQGNMAVVETDANPDTHVILRGGKFGGKSSPNHDPESVAACQEKLLKKDCMDNVMIDCSHGNSLKDFTRQPIVCREVGDQMKAGNAGIFGVMIESNLFSGRQDLPPSEFEIKSEKHSVASTKNMPVLKKLKYGVSVTDGCVDWDTTKVMLEDLASAVRDRRSHAHACALYLCAERASEMDYGRVMGLDKPVSRIVFGTLFLHNTPEPFKLLDTVWNSGTNAFDCAAIYGGGQCEKILGEWIKDRKIPREDVVLITKGGCNGQDKLWSADLSQSSVSRDLYQSLENLGVSSVDVYMLHRDDENLPVKEIVDMLDGLQKQGAFKVWGVSNWTNERLQEAIAYAHNNNKAAPVCDSLQFGLMTPSKAVWPNTQFLRPNHKGFYRESGVAVFAWECLAKGFGTARWGAPKDVASSRELESDLSSGRVVLRPSGDTADLWRQHQLAVAYCTPENFTRRDRVAAMAEQKGSSMAEVLLQYVASQPFESFVLVGTTNVEHFKQNVKAGVKRNLLTPEELHYLDHQDGKNLSFPESVGFECSPGAASSRSFANSTTI